MGKLLLLFILVPAGELMLLIKLGGLIGVFSTVAVIVVTGTLGATLARWQGLSVLSKMQRDLAGGVLPAGPLVDGAIILVAAALLVTPGFLTDVVGFLCLVPAFRTVLKNFARRRLERAVQEGRTNVFVQFGQMEVPHRPRSGPDSSGNIEM